MGVWIFKEKSEETIISLPDHVFSEAPYFPVLFCTAIDIFLRPEITSDLIVVGGKKYHEIHGFWQTSEVWFWDIFY